MPPTKAEIEALQTSWRTGPRQIYAFAAAHCRLPADLAELTAYNAETDALDRTMDLRSFIPGYAPPGGAAETVLINSYITEKGRRPGSAAELGTYYQGEVLHGRNFVPGHGYPPPNCTTTAAPIDGVGNQLGNVATRVTDWVKDNPALAIGGAVVAYFVLGSGSSRRRGGLF